MNLTFFLDQVLNYYTAVTLYLPSRSLSLSLSLFLTRGAPSVAARRARDSPQASQEAAAAPAPCADRVAFSPTLNIRFNIALNLLSI